MRAVLAGANAMRCDAEARRSRWGGCDRAGGKLCMSELLVRLCNGDFGRDACD